MSTATMHNRYTASLTARVQALETVREFERFAVRVTLPPDVYRSPDGTSIAVPELIAVVSGNTCALTVELCKRYIDTLNALELDVLHCKSVMLSFAVGEIQYTESVDCTIGEIDSEIDDDVTLLHRYKQISADLIKR